MKATRTFIVLSAVATGCQVISGLSGIDSEAGAGGEPAASATTTATSSGGDGGARSSSDGTSSAGGGVGGDEASPTECIGNAGCGTDEFCFITTSAPGEGRCVGCGASPDGGPAMCGMCGFGGDDVTSDCQGAMCEHECPSAGCPSPNTNPTPVIRLDARSRPATMHCRGDECNGLVFQCRGAYECTLECDTSVAAQGDTCDGITLNCDPNGVCNVVCLGDHDCNIIQNCGDNECNAQCQPNEAEQQVAQLGCENACACNVGNCEALSIP
ncbi:MAG: hypothetical protein AAGN82_26485 [Myxococcota bacterium]